VEEDEEQNEARVCAAPEHGLDALHDLRQLRVVVSLRLRVCGVHELGRHRQLGPLGKGCCAFVASASLPRHATQTRTFELVGLQNGPPEAHKDASGHNSAAKRMCEVAHALAVRKRDVELAARSEAESGC
jgi:hypothetical protein